MESWLWAAVAVWGAMVVLATDVSFVVGVVAAAVGKIPSQIPRENHCLLLLRIEVLLDIYFCSRYFLLTCHDVKTKY
eukprot:scaffold33389_cov91-Cyclotella_meneghiniana.AAC.4